MRQRRRLRRLYLSLFLHKNAGERDSGYSPNIGELEAYIMYKRKVKYRSEGETLFKDHCIEKKMGFNLCSSFLGQNLGKEDFSQISNPPPHQQKSISSGERTPLGYYLTWWLVHSAIKLKPVLSINTIKTGFLKDEQSVKESQVFMKSSKMKYEGK